MADKFTAIISNYAPRGNLGVSNLINQLIDVVDRIIIVINDDSCAFLHKKISNEIIRITRPNTGMNIGAWSEAIEYISDSDYTIFLQDECRLLRADFIDNYKYLLSQPNIGMIGESVNPKWDCEWLEISNSRLNYLINFSNGQSISRVSYYLECMKKWNINPGIRSTHLRSLVWAFNKKGIDAIDHFPIGLNKEECIAAEIAVSRKLIQKGLEFRQSDSSSFTYFEHHEWQKDGFSKKQT